MNPLFSIILPTYNRASSVSCAIKSVIDQTYSNWELIVVNDGSTDHTEEVIKKFQDHRITYLAQSNKGRSMARNNGLAMAKGDYITFLDDDDCYEPDHLGNYIPFLGESNTIIKMGAKHITAEEIVLDISHYQTELSINEYLLFYGIAVWQCCFPSSVKHITFNENLSYAEDQDWILRLLINKYGIKEIEASSIKYNCINKDLESIPLSVIINQFIDKCKVLLNTFSSLERLNISYSFYIKVLLFSLYKFMLQVIRKVFK